MSELCCICLDEFTRPASLPCGHCFCLACIGEYWRISGSCQCPLCKAFFPTRPQLQTHPTTQSQVGAAPLKAGEVPCDLCPGRRRAVKSCLVCLASYCDAHLELHYQSEDLGRHLLIGVAKNLEDPVCRVHGKPLDRFCRSDRTCVCAMCSQTEHRGHHIIPVHKEAAKKKVKSHWRMYVSPPRPNNIQLKRMRMKLQQVIQERLSQVEDLKETRTQSKELIKQLEGEICELQRKHTELEQLSQTEDDLHFLQVRVSRSEVTLSTCIL
ncbi:E3 ubiquitin-protein ligase TRIM47-like [Hippoglossus hippoglossus]|uniref:E3 ubiquitin-protein ligase TRIM47-like n=1 Tax=Hippoglossus hippoglossus TaxID=8267 RepID=UPI00148DDF6F|nr:E3 ubiquitin-protein ligase TRIM47-like [Hippoglossus hippoglossus]